MFGFISNQFRFRKQIDNQIVRVLKYPLIDAFYMVVQIEKKKRFVASQQFLHQQKRRIIYRKYSLSSNSVSVSRPLSVFFTVNGCSKRSVVETVILLKINFFFFMQKSKAQRIKLFDSLCENRFFSHSMKMNAT